MQTLGLSDSTPRPEGRLKSLLWPTIRNEGDFDYVTRQGFWVCQAVAVTPVFVGGILLWAGPVVAFYFLAGVGVRERSRVAGIAAFGVYLFESFLSGLGLVRILFLALLFANVRGSWLSYRWKPEVGDDSAEPWRPLRLNETLADKFADQWPPRIWRVGRWVFYLLVALRLSSLSTYVWGWANSFVTLGTKVI